MTKELEKALRHIKTRADLWAVREVEKALSQEPCNDAISREAVIDTLQYAWEANKDIQESIVEIKALPPVTQKSGKWTLMYEPKNMVVCSECGKCAYMYQNKTSAFCPNCGAKNGK